MEIRLSICIPTRNRAPVLAAALHSLTSQPFFLTHPDIEVVVSDNASTDHTAHVAAEFVARFNGRVRYFRNDTDLVNQNFEAALRRGQGKFLKLLNDTVTWKPQGLETLYELVVQHENQQPVLFMLNGCKKTPQALLQLQGVDAFVQTASFYMGWIGAFGIWKTQLDAMPDFSRCADKGLAQVDVLLRLMALRPEVVVCNTVCFDVQDGGRKGGYALAQVFGVDYLDILRSHMPQLSAQTFAAEKKAVLLEHILAYQFHPDHDFYVHPLEDVLQQTYGDEPYYLPAVQAARAQWMAVTEAKGQPKKRSGWRASWSETWTHWMLKLRPRHPKYLAKLWRLHNAHNDTSMGAPFDFSKVEVGHGSYGRLNVHTWGRPEERLAIGHHVSIAENVQFLLGGNHAHHQLSTYPFKVKMLGHPNESHTKGPITVQDDVWIGHGAMILSGVTLHQGCVIGAGAVVTRDVPPYAIVAGNPAQVVKYRFSQELVQKLLALRLADLTPEAVRSRPDLVSAKITLENIDNIAQGLRLKGPTP
jgi:acetyltransferase-like isoleucine patch superfamily enzyme